MKDVDFKGYLESIQNNARMAAEFIISNANTHGTSLFVTLTQEQALNIFKALASNTSVLELKVQLIDDNVEDGVAYALSTLVSENKKLKRLAIVGARKNFFYDEQLPEALKKNNTLKHLELSMMYCTDPHQLHFAQVFITPPSL